MFSMVDHRTISFSEDIDAERSIEDERNPGRFRVAERFRFLYMDPALQEIYPAKI